MANGYRLSSTRTIRIAGLRRLVTNQSQGYLFEQEIPSDEIDFSYSNHLFAEQSTAPLVELKANVPQKNKWMFSLSVRYELGIQNMTNTGNRFADPNRATTFEWIEDDFKNSTLMVSLGISKLFYRIKLKG
jgi:hypothetical protein